MTKKIRKPISFILSIIMIVSVFAAVPMTAYAAPTESLLITINSKGHGEEWGDGFISGSRTFNNIATVTFSSEVENDDDDDGWYTSGWSNIILSVAPAAGYTITKVKFTGRNGSAFDETSPFEATLYAMNMYVNGSSCGGGGVTKIEVYGYAAPTTYTVTWKNADGTTLETDTDVEEGATPVYNGATPAKADDSVNTYEFAGWNDGTTTYAPDTLPAVTGNVTYTATFTETEKPEVIKDCTYQSGDIYANVPIIDVENLAALPDGNLVVLPESGKVTIAYAKCYIFKFYDKTGTELQAVLNEGLVSPGTDLGLSDDVQVYQKEFTLTLTQAAAESGYYIVATEPDSDVSKDCTYSTYLAGNDVVCHANVPLTGPIETLEVLLDGTLCIMSAERDSFGIMDTKGYTYKFYDETGTELTLHSSMSTTSPGSEANLGDDVTIYKNVYDSGFPNGCTDVFIVATVPAPTYTVTWKNWDGTELEKDESVEKDSLPKYDGETPAKAEDENYTYTFAGWTPEVVAATADVEYTATFTAEDKHVAAVISMIAALPAPEDVTVNDKNAIEAAGYAYVNLSNDQKVLVPAESTAKLQAVAQAFAAVAKEAADQAAADGVTYLINQIPAEVTSDNAEAVENARKAYNMLTDDQKALIDADTLAKLEAAEDALLPELENHSSVETDNTTLNSEVKLFGAAEGGKPDYTYAFMYKLPGSTKWKVLGTKFGDSDQETLVVEKSGTYTVLISVMDSKGSKVSKEFSIDVEDTTVVNNSSVSKTEVLCGEKVTITGAAEGVEGPYLYTYQVKKPGKSSWTTLGEKYTDATSKEFTAKLSGEYEVRVLVKDSAGFIKSFKTTVTSTGTLLVNKSTISTTSAVVGDSVTLNAVAEEGTAPYRYTYELKKPGETKFKTVGKRGSNNESASFTADTAGTYEAKVFIQDESNYVTVKTFNITVSE